MRKQLRGSAFLLIATILWGSTFVDQSVCMDHIGPFTFQAARCALAVIGLLPVIAISDRFKKDGQTFCSRWTDKKLWEDRSQFGLFSAVALRSVTQQILCI